MAWNSGPIQKIGPEGITLAIKMETVLAMKIVLVTAPTKKQTNKNKRKLKKIKSGIYFSGIRKILH